jgi:chromosome segregation ATPase
MAQLKMGQRAAIERVTKAALQEPRRRQLDPLSPRISGLEEEVAALQAPDPAREARLAVLEEAVVALQTGLARLEARVVELEGAQP